MKSVIEILIKCGFFNFAEHTLIDLDPMALYDVIENIPYINNEEGTKELVDFENFEVLSINSDKMEVCAGGDWQNPIKFSLIPYGEKLIATDIMPGFEFGLNLDNIELLLH
jgi:hypothetical protein